MTVNTVRRAFKVTNSAHLIRNRSKRQTSELKALFLNWFPVCGEKKNTLWTEAQISVIHAVVLLNPVLLAGSCCLQ